MTRRFTRGEKAVGGAFIAFWIFCVLLSIGFTAVVIWGIVQLVQWVTAQ